MNCSSKTDKYGAVNVPWKLSGFDLTESPAAISEDRTSQKDAICRCEGRRKVKVKVKRTCGEFAKVRNLQTQLPSVIRCKLVCIRGTMRELNVENFVHAI